MKIAFVLGTRPEIIKMSPIIRACQEAELDYFVVHTGQHYSYEMDRLFYEQLGFPEPKYNLAIKSSSPIRQSEHTGKMLIEIEGLLLEEKPNVVLVQGDTNTVLAASIAVSKLKTNPINMPMKLGHVEAGLRSFDRGMTEEINRIHADHMADFLFAPSDKAKDYLLREANEQNRIHVTGNTIVDAVMHHLEQAESSDILDKLGLEKEKYIVVTAHRQENVDDKKRLLGILEGIDLVGKETGLKIIYPMHPRTKKIIADQGIIIPGTIEVIEPVGFFESLHLQKNAALIITDSGGLQEEASILQTPCITVRDNTERPETVDHGYNRIVGTTPENILAGAKEMLEKNHDWKPLYGKGDAAKKIVDILINDFNQLS